MWISFCNYHKDRWNVLDYLMKENSSLCLEFPFVSISLETLALKGLNYTA